MVCLGRRMPDANKYLHPAAKATNNGDTYRMGGSDSCKAVETLKEKTFVRLHVREIIPLLIGVEAEHLGLSSPTAWRSG